MILKNQMKPATVEMLVENESKQEYQARTGNFNMFIEPLSEEAAIQIGRALGSAFYGYSSSSDLETGDRVTQDSVIYVIQGKQVNEFGLATKHTQYTLVRDDSS